MPHPRAAAAVILLVLGAAGPAAAQMMEHGMNGPANPADKAFVDAMSTMMVGMHQSVPTGDTDRDFVALMVPHHQSAVDMAKAELHYGGDIELKNLAKSIIDDQEREIAMMKAWQDKHPKP